MLSFSQSLAVIIAFPLITQVPLASGHLGAYLTSPQDLQSHGRSGSCHRQSSPSTTGHPLWALVYKWSRFLHQDSLFSDLASCSLLLCVDPHHQSNSMICSCSCFRSQRQSHLVRNPSRGHAVKRSWSCCNIILFASFIACNVCNILYSLIYFIDD